jgi:hypothetical protein
MGWLFFVGIFLFVGCFNLLVAFVCQKAHIISSWFYEFNDNDERIINGYKSILFLVVGWPITMIIPVLHNIVEWRRETRCKKR